MRYLTVCFGDWFGRGDHEHRVASIRLQGQALRLYPSSSIERGRVLDAIAVCRYGKWLVAMEGESFDDTDGARAQRVRLVDQLPEQLILKWKKRPPEKIREGVVAYLELEDLILAFVPHFSSEVPVPGSRWMCHPGSVLGESPVDSKRILLLAHLREQISG